VITVSMSSVSSMDHHVVNLCKCTLETSRIAISIAVTDPRHHHHHRHLVSVLPQLENKRAETSRELMGTFQMV
jgi:hypothetical protein